MYSLNQHFTEKGKKTPERWLSRMVVWMWDDFGSLHLSLNFSHVWWCMKWGIGTVTGEGSAWSVLVPWLLSLGSEDPTVLEEESSSPCGYGLCSFCRSAPFLGHLLVRALLGMKRHLIPSPCPEGPHNPPQDYKVVSQLQFDPRSNEGIVSMVSGFPSSGDSGGAQGLELGVCRIVQAIWTTYARQGIGGGYLGTLGSEREATQSPLAGQCQGTSGLISKVLWLEGIACQGVRVVSCTSLLLQTLGETRWVSFSLESLLQNSLDSLLTLPPTGWFAERGSVACSEGKTENFVVLSLL